MANKTAEELATIIARDKEKPGLGNIDLKKTRVLLLDGGCDTARCTPAGQSGQ